MLIRNKTICLAILLLLILPLLQLIDKKLRRSKEVECLIPKPVARMIMNTMEVAAVPVIKREGINKQQSMIIPENSFPKEIKVEGLLDPKRSLKNRELLLKISLNPIGKSKCLLQSITNSTQEK